MASGIRVLNHFEALIEDALEHIDIDEEVLYDITLELNTGQPVYNFMIVFPARIEEQHRCYIANFSVLIPSQELMLEWVKKVVEMNEEASRREAGMLHLN